MRRSLPYAKHTVTAAQYTGHGSDGYVPEIARRALICVQNVKAEIHACGGARLWQYISLRDGSAEQPARVP